MSQYLRVLKRIEQDRDGASAVSLPVKRAQSPKPDIHIEPLENTPPRSSTPPTAAAFATLFDNLRAAGNGQPIRHLVVAAAAASDSVRTVVDGLAAHAQGVGFTVVVAEVTRAAGRSVLRCCATSVAEQIAPVDPLPVELHDAGWQASFTDWLARAASDADLVIVQGPPLAQTVDAALLSRACDGLVIVADVLRTTGDDLRTAAERARAVGSRALGIVLNTPTHRLPEWLRRLTGAGRPHGGQLER
jgi:hypothetical protein